MEEKKDSRNKRERGRERGNKKKHEKGEKRKAVTRKSTR